MSQIREILQNTLLLKVFQFNNKKKRLKNCQNPEEPKKTGGQMECDMRDGNLAKKKKGNLNKVRSLVNANILILIHLLIFVPY